jgi:hypothetical protein
MFAAILSVLVPSMVWAHTTYSVIFSGGYDRWNNHDRYYEETLRMWQIQTGILGYDMDKVYVLFADGTNPAVDRSSGVSSDWSMIPATGHIAPATRANLMSTIGLIRDELIGPEDSFHFWSFDHGSNPHVDPSDPTTYPPTIEDTELVAWGTPWITDVDFASWVNPLNVKGEMYAFGQCFAGGMVDDLNILPGENRFAAWAADWYEYSWGKGWADAWADGLEAGLVTTYALGQYAVDNDPYGPMGTGAEHPGWTGDDFNILTNEPEAIPEPSTILLIGSGIFGLAAFFRRRKAA